MSAASVFLVAEAWRDAAHALATAREMVRAAGAKATPAVLWQTRRLDVVEQLRDVLEGASGDAHFHARDPAALAAELRAAGIEPHIHDDGSHDDGSHDDGSDDDGSGPRLRAIGYGRILDALRHARHAYATTLSIELGHAGERGLDAATLDRLVAAAAMSGATDAFQAHWSWDGTRCGVTLDLHGDVGRHDGHRPDVHRLTVSVDDPHGRDHELAQQIGRGWPLVLLTVR